MTDMNSNEIGIEPALDPWINAGPTGPAISPSIITPEEKQKGQAELFKVCQDEVLRRWENGKDNLGRSTAWKASAAREDIANKRSDSSIMEQLAKEVVAIMDKYF